MDILLSISTVLFVILCVLLVILILLQSDKSAGMGILGGSSQSAFGSSTADVITKITSVMVAIFMVGSLGLAVIKANTAGDIESLILKDNKAGGEVLKDGTEAEKKEAMEEEASSEKDSSPKELKEKPVKTESK